MSYSSTCGRYAGELAGALGHEMRTLDQHQSRCDCTTTASSGVRGCIRVYISNARDPVSQTIDLMQSQKKLWEIVHGPDGVPRSWPAKLTRAAHIVVKPGLLL